jgi:1,4-dihydroxy-2-naphthoate octaprenyltransferase
VGTVFAWRQTGQLSWQIVFLCLGFAAFMQIGANFANDYFDFRRGADREDRIGPVRAVASGAIKPRTMLICAVLVLAIGFALGLVLMWTSNGGWALLGVGVASVVCALAYTAGPWPLAYVGLGDLFVLLFFGLIAVSVTHFVQLRVAGAAWEQVPWLPALGVGLIINNLLVVNNHRDADTDRRAGKGTLVVRFGRPFGVASYLLAVVFATLVFPLQEDGLRAALFLLPVGLFFTHRLAKTSDPRDYAFVFAGTAALVFLYGLACVASALWLSPAGILAE